MPSTVRLISIFPTSVSLTNRARYLESIDILYSENTLSVRQTRTIVDLQRTILPQRLDRIRSLRLSFPLNLYCIDAEGQKLAMCPHIYPLDVPYFWAAAWETITAMKSLQSLQVEFTRWLLDDRRDPDPAALLHLLKPMRAVHVPRYVVDVYFNLDTAAIVRALDALPFEIRIRERIASFRRP